MTNKRRLGDVCGLAHRAPVSVDVFRIGEKPSDDIIVGTHGNLIRRYARLNAIQMKAPSVYSPFRST